MIDSSAHSPSNIHDITVRKIKFFQNPFSRQLSARPLKDEKEFHFTAGAAERF